LAADSDSSSSDCQSLALVSESTNSVRHKPSCCSKLSFPSPPFFESWSLVLVTEPQSPMIAAATGTRNSLIIGRSKGVKNSAERFLKPVRYKSQRGLNNAITITRSYELRLFWLRRVIRESGRQKRSIRNITK
jgi:hypothetical protein